MMIHVDVTSVTKKEIDEMPKEGEESLAIELINNSINELCIIIVFAGMISTKWYFLAPTLNTSILGDLYQTYSPISLSYVFQLKYFFNIKFWICLIYKILRKYRII